LLSYVYFVLVFVVSTIAIDCLKGLVFEMTHCVSTGQLNADDSMIHFLEKFCTSNTIVRCFYWAEMSFQLLYLSPKLYRITKGFDYHRSGTLDWVSSKLIRRSAPIATVLLICLSGLSRPRHYLVNKTYRAIDQL